MRECASVECDLSQKVVKKEDLLRCIVDRGKPIVQVPDCDKLPAFGDVGVGQHLR